MLAGCVKRLDALSSAVESALLGRQDHTQLRAALARFAAEEDPCQVRLRRLLTDREPLLVRALGDPMLRMRAQRERAARQAALEISAVQQLLPTPAPCGRCGGWSPVGHTPFSWRITCRAGGSDPAGCDPCRVCLLQLLARSAARLRSWDFRARLACARAAATTGGTQYTATNFSFGTTPFQTWAQLAALPSVRAALSRCRAAPGCEGGEHMAVFGSSTGLIAMYAALAHGAAVVGYELLPELVQEAEQARNCLGVDAGQGAALVLRCHRTPTRRYAQWHSMRPTCWRHRWRAWRCSYLRRSAGTCRCSTPWPRN